MPILPAVEDDGFESFFMNTLCGLRLKLMIATTVESNIRSIFMSANNVMSINEIIKSWMSMKRARYGIGFIDIDYRNIKSICGLLSDSIAYDLIKVTGRGAATRFELTKSSPVYERTAGGARFILPPGPRSTGRERHTAYVAPLLIDRLTRIAHHPAARSPLIPDHWVSKNWVHPGGVMIEALPRLILIHENADWLASKQLMWLAIVNKHLWNLDYKLPDTEIHETDLEALKGLV
jgi:hypothetical protein